MIHIIFTRSGFPESTSESEDLSRQVQDEKQSFELNLKDLHLLSELKLKFRASSPEL